MTRLWVLTGVVVWLASATAMQAHRVDEYLQATRISVGPDRIGLEIDLTPGIDVAGRVLRLIDLDADGELSDAERSRYAGQVISATRLDLDGRPVSVALSSAHFPPVDELRAGTGTIRLRASAPARSVSSGSHELHFANVHEPTISAYLVNALMPGSGIAIVDQRRDVWQRQFVLRFTGESAASPLTRWPVFLSGLGVMLLLWRVRGRGAHDGGSRYFRPKITNHFPS